MAAKHGRRSADATNNIKRALGGILSSGDFFVEEFLLPPEGGAQLSMTGDIVAYGNGGDFTTALSTALRGYSSMERSSDAEFAKIVSRRRFTVLCGDCDRSAAIFESICEAVRQGIVRIVVIADSPSERDNMFRSLGLMCAGKSGIEVSEYRADDYEFFVKYKSMATVYGFLTSACAQVLVIGRDSLARRNNVINKEYGNVPMSSLIARARPVVFTSSATVSSGRTLADIATVFDPIASFVFAGEVRRLRDAVIYEPTDTNQRRIRSGKSEPEQLGF